MKLFAIGRIGRPLGVKGEVLVYPFARESSSLLGQKQVWLRRPPDPEQAREVLSSRRASGGVALWFRGVTDRDAAARLNGLEVLIPRESFAELPPGEYYEGDLIGMRVVDSQGAPLGVLEEIWETGGADVFVVRGGGAELLVPVAPEFVKEVDLPGGRIVVVPPVVEED